MITKSNLFLLTLLVLLTACQVQITDQTTTTEATKGIGSKSLSETTELRLETPAATAEILPSDLSVVTSVAPNTPTVIPTRTNTPDDNLSESQTPLATPTSSQTPTATLTPTKSFGLTATSIAQSDPIDRSCPNPPPGKPDYNHYFLSPEKWIQPDNTNELHLWFGKPLAGGGRLLYTDWLPYGYDAGGRYLIHNGIDSAEPAGSPLLAAEDGLIVVAGEDLTRLYGWRCDWYGKLVVIKADVTWRNQPVYMVYGHVSNIEVEVGQRVSRGQKIAEVSIGGAAQLPHLHFEVRVGSNEFSSTRNPLLWLEPPPTRGLIVGRLVDPEGRPWQGVAVAAVGRSEGTKTHTTWTYLDDPQHLINGDEALAENFVFGDLRPGEYELYVELQGQAYKMPLTVNPGEITLTELVTEVYKTATPQSQVPIETPVISDSENE